MNQARHPSQTAFSEHHVHWLQGEPIQNFGDFLSAYLLDRLFVRTPRRSIDMRLIGSFLDDGFVPERDQSGGAASEAGFQEFALTAWGGGVRQPGGLSPEVARFVNILSVRGPLSAHDLGLGDTAPMGDPGFLLPALYEPREDSNFVGKSVCIPHFHDKRTDYAILQLTGADLILRPSIRRSLAAIESFIDALTSSRFVLCASLHGAVAAAAYGRPFAFWQSGQIDLPFKWQDFAASVKIPVGFQGDVSTGESFYWTHIEPVLSLPSMWKMLAAAPYFIRPSALLRILRLEQRRAGIATENVVLNSAIRVLESGASYLEEIALDAASIAQTLALQADSLSSELAKALASKETIERLEAEVEAKSAAADNAAVAVGALGARIQELQDDFALLKQRAHDSEESANNSAMRLDALASERDEARDVAERANAKLSNVRGKLLEQIHFLGHGIDKLGTDLERPLSLLVSNLQFNVLKSLISWRAMFTARAIGRFAQSAHKRRPGRTLDAVKAVWDGLNSLSKHLDGEQAVAAAGRATTGPGEGKDLLRAFNALHGSEAVYFPPVADPEVSIVIPVYKGQDLLLACLRSLSVHRSVGPSFEVIVIDDCPSEPVLWNLPTSGGLRMFTNDVNLGFLLTCRRGAELARGDILCFLNSDTLVSAGWLGALTAALNSKHRVGMVGSLLLNQDGSIQDAGWRILSDGWGYPLGRQEEAADGRYTHRRRVDCVTGACFAIAKQRWLEVGGFDIVYAPAFYEEFDLAFRLKRMGFHTMIAPGSRVVHLGSASYGAAERDRLSGVNHETFTRRFEDELRKQPVAPSDSFDFLCSGPRRPVILVVDLSLPEPDRHAGDVTLFGYLCLLADAGWRVIFGPRRGQTVGPHALALEDMGIEIVRPPVSVEGWLLRYGDKVDHVLLCRPEIAADLVSHVRAQSKARLSYYTHDLHFLRMERDAALHRDSGKARAAAEMRTQELDVLMAVDQVLTPSEVERTVILELMPKQNVVAVTPYFFESEDITSYDAGHFNERNDILFVGGFPHTPNVDAAIFIATEVMPKVWAHFPNTQLLLVGYSPPPEVLALAGRRVIVTGQVNDLAPWFDRSRLMLAALRYGAGVKGKVVEALRRGLPVVGTTIAAEGIGISPGCDALIHEASTDLASAVLSLLSDPAHCARLSVAGADLIRRRYSRQSARRLFQSVFNVPRCAVCGSTRMISYLPTEAIREKFVCQDCFALARTAALSRVVCLRIGEGSATHISELFSNRPDLRAHEFGFAGGISDALRGLRNFSNSDFFPDITLGQLAPNGVRCEDLTCLSFEDSSFDVLISQDVLEHVPEPALALAEIARVLRPGGSHFFTVPQSRNRSQSVTRARMGTNGIEYILPADYHGDPIRSEGALVFTDFGLDLEQMVIDAGLLFSEHRVSLQESGNSDILYVFEASKKHQHL